MQSTRTPTDPAKIKETKERAYQRNMSMMREYLGSHPCSACKKSFPAFAMTFATKPGEPSVSRLAGSRIAAEALGEAMKLRRVLCKQCARQ